MSVKIITDSACDLPLDLIGNLGVEVVPLTVRFGDTEYVDGRDITPTEFWAKCAASAELPQTAAPSQGSFEEAYRRAAAAGASGIVVVSLSAELSATIQSAQLAARDWGGQIPVRIVDSLNASMGQGLIVIECAERARQGASIDEIVALAEDLAPRTFVFGALDPLENLKKGGRIGGAKALLATALSIKPLIEIRGGKVEEAGKARTRSKALAVLVDQLANHKGRIERLGILHAQCADVDAFIEMVKKVHDGPAIVGDIGAVIGTHAGQGTIGIAFRIAK
ncbi:MAG: DegV family protein [Actinomycetota bacterium]